MTCHICHTIADSIARASIIVAVFYNIDHSEQSTLLSVVDHHLPQKCDLSDCDHLIRTVSDLY